MGNAGTLPDIWNIVQAGGATAALLVFAWAVMAGRIVPGYLYRAKVRECEAWQRQSLTLLGVADKAITHIEATQRERDG